MSGAKVRIKIETRVEKQPVQKYVELADLGKGFPTNIYLQKLASMQPRTNRSGFAHTCLPPSLSHECSSGGHLAAEREHGQRVLPAAVQRHLRGCLVQLPLEHERVVLGLHWVHHLGASERFANFLDVMIKTPSIKLRKACSRLIQKYVFAYIRANDYKNTTWSSVGTTVFNALSGEKLEFDPK